MTTHHRVLIVEDETKIAELLRDYLQAASFAVSCLYQGDGVISDVKKNPPDLILLDVMLPGKDGMEICRAIRKFSSVPIIMITARVEEIDRLIGLELGADDYICKPFSPREVVARVKAVLRRAGPSQSFQRLAAGPIVLDKATRRVTIDGQPISLTPTRMAEEGTDGSHAEISAITTSPVKPTPGMNWRPTPAWAMSRPLR